MKRDDAPKRTTGVRVPRRLDRLVSLGRLTPDEADRLRAAGEADAEVLVGIRVRHAEERLDAVVAAGEIDREEAEEILGRLRAGEHSRELRARLNRLGRPSRVADESTGSGNPPQDRRPA